MNHTTAETFLILIQNPDKPGFMVSEHIRSIGLIGSILLDLSLEEKIDLESGRLKAKSTQSSLSLQHNQILEEVAKSSKEKKIKNWISRFSRHAKKFQKEILLQLEKESIIKIDHKRFLFFRYYRTRLLDKSLRIRLIDDIREKVLHSKPFKKEESAILGLIEACNMHKVICRNKEEKKLCKSKLKDLVKSDRLFRELDAVIRETQAAIHAAIIASSVATTAATT